MSKKNKHIAPKIATATKPAATAVRDKKPLLLPILPLFFIATWVWSSFYYGSVYHIAREYSFWSMDMRQLQFIMNQPYAPLRYVGRALLQLWQWPWAGGLLLSGILTVISWLVGYCMRLRPALRPVQYLPALAYIGIVSYNGINAFFEAEAGLLMGVPFLALLILSIWGIIIRSFSRKPVPALIGIPHDEAPRQNRLQLAVIVLGFAAIVSLTEMTRPYNRVICRIMAMYEQQDWNGIQKVARENAELSYRPIACYYAISLLHTGQIAERMYDIRLDYDSLYLHGMDHQHNNASCLYLPEGNYHGGFIESSIHAAMEQMVMTGPTLRLLKIQIKCALMRGEWELAKKYLRILKDVPFEGEFISKYEPMVGHDELVNADREMAKIRLTEPIHDSFENQYQQPLFMGYNLALTEGRSTDALINSLCVCLYTKLMPQFMARLEPIAGTTPPEIITDGILLASNKQPGIEQNFQGMNFRIGRIQSFMEATQQYMSDRPGHARELFNKYKGYYPYYYFFGNLKATKKGYTGANTTSNSGVN